jgi:hypothetical protein
MDPEFGEDTLGVVSSRVGADIECGCNDRVRAAQRQEASYLGLSGGKPVPRAKVHALSLVPAAAPQPVRLPLELVSKLAKLVERPADLAEEGPTIPVEHRKGGENGREVMWRHARKRCVSLPLLTCLHRCAKVSDTGGRTSRVAVCSYLIANRLPSRKVLDFQAASSRNSP